MPFSFYVSLSPENADDVCVALGAVKQCAVISKEVLLRKQQSRSEEFRDEKKG